jgi:hypothetical protein
MSAFLLLYRPAKLTPDLQPVKNTLLPPSNIIRRLPISVYDLAPLHLQRTFACPVSYYAFFKGLLLLSKPPGCLSKSTSFTT